MATIFHTATEYVANELTILRGSVSDISAVGVYHTTNPSEIPAVEDFTTVTLVDGVKVNPDPLSEEGKIDVISLIGPASGDVELVAGDYQRFVLVQTSTENIIRKVDVLEVL